MNISGDIKKLKTNINKRKDSIVINKTSIYKSLRKSVNKYVCWGFITVH